MHMSELRRFMPYVVEIGQPPCTAPVHPAGRRLRWAIVVCDREYNLLFATWLARKPTRNQVQAFSRNAGSGAVNWSDEGGRNWLYHDGCIPTSSIKNWEDYSIRLRALSRLRGLHDSHWASENPEDYVAALAKWVDRTTS